MSSALTREAKDWLRTISVFPALYPATDSEYRIQWGTYGDSVKEVGSRSYSFVTGI